MKDHEMHKHKHKGNMYENYRLQGEKLWGTVEEKFQGAGTPEKHLKKKIIFVNPNSSCFKDF